MSSTELLMMIMIIMVVSFIFFSPSDIEQQYRRYKLTIINFVYDEPFSDGPLALVHDCSVLLHRSPPQSQPIDQSASE